MGARKLKWTDEEEKALRAGVDKHGAGKWKTILKDPDFAGSLSARSNVDLKDKWRNMSVSALGGLAPRERKIKKSNNLITNGEASPVISAEIISESKKYDDQILDALRALQGDPNGSDTNAILTHIKSKQDLPPHFKRLLGSKLRELISKGLIHKVGTNGYALTMTAPDPSHVQVEVGKCIEKMNETSISAVRKIVQAEAMSALARDAAREAEFASRLADEADALVEVYSSLSHSNGGGGSITVCS